MKKSNHYKAEVIARWLELDDVDEVLDILLGNITESEVYDAVINASNRYEMQDYGSK